MAGQTMLDKVWARHVVATGPGGRALLYVDRHLVHEVSFHAFEMLHRAGRGVRRPDLTVAVADHYVPTAPPRRSTAHRPAQVATRRRPSDRCPPMEAVRSVRARTKGSKVSGDRVGPWRPVESTWAFRSGFLSIRRDRCRLPDGRLSPDMYFMELRDFAMTVAVTPDGEVLLCREYKHGAGDVAYTLPAGFVEPGEAPPAAARRELREETGRDGEALEPLGAYLVFPSLSGARGHFFLAPGVQRVAAPQPDEFEEIEVVPVTLDELRKDLRAATPRYLTDISSALAVGLALPRLDGRA